MDSKPLIIALASGKGGVGKTMLTVACAYELAFNSKTLLVDLDFFNRGLSGLFRQPLPPERGGSKPVPIDRPQFLETDPFDPTPPEPRIVEEPWEVWKIERNLFHIHFPDTSNREDDALERGANVSRQERVITQARQLESWLLKLAKDFGFQAIVLDCHGGPDPMSFSAAFIADYTLLVSEPDRITLHGTLNFLRKLWRVCGEEAPDVRLVFNKVIPQFRVRFLERFYNTTLRSEFLDEKLLAVFPLEIYLTKAFEQTPILTKVYPHSLLARKMQLLLRDLLYLDQKEFLRRITICQPKWLRQYRYYTIGKKLWLYDHTIVLSVISASWVVLFAASLARLKLGVPLRKLAESSAVGEFLSSAINAMSQSWDECGALALAWLLTAILWHITVWFDRVAIVAARKGRTLKTIICFFGLWMAWLPGAFLANLAITRANDIDLLRFGSIPSLFLFIWVIMWLGFRSYRQARYTSRWFEVAVQLGFIVLLIGEGIMAFLVL